MPIYDFRCRDCGLEFEELVPRMGQVAPCPKCSGKNVERLPSIPAAHHGGNADNSPASRHGATDCGFA